MTGRTLAGPFAMFAPPAVWAAVFLLAYASESVVCSRWNSPGLHAVLVMSAGIAGLATLAILAHEAARHAAATDREARFEARASLTLAGLSAIALLWTMLPAVLLSACMG